VRDHSNPLLAALRMREGVARFECRNCRATRGFAFGLAVGDRAMARTQWPVRLSDDTDVQPDLSVVRVRSRHRDHHLRSSVAFAEIGHGRRGLIEGVTSIDHRRHLPLAHELGKHLEVGRV
jgi:hypothetical protein